jgi:sarcosine oxidase
MIKVAVIGSGMAGSAAALALARRGAKVTLFDQFPFGHDRGSSHGATRLFRTAYCEHPNYVPILQRALLQWRDLQRAAGETLIVEAGLVEAGPPDGPMMRGLRAAVAEHRLPVVALSGAEIKRAHPLLHVPAHFEAIFEREAGFVFAGKTVAAQIRLAARDGAILRPETRILDWAQQKNGVVVHAQGGAETFDRLVIAAGAWAQAFIRARGADVAPIAKTLFWRRPPTDRFTLQAGFAPFAIETGDYRFFYGFPAIDADGVKIAEHTGGRPLATPEERPSAPSADEERAIEEFLATTIPDLAGRPDSFQLCLYEASRDEHFIVDRHPECDRVVFAAGLSGHGFKFAPALGEALAVMALDDRTPAEWEFLSLTRFG